MVSIPRGKYLGKPLGDCPRTTPSTSSASLPATAGLSDLVLDVANSKAFRGRSPTALMESCSVAVYAAIVSTFTVVAGLIQ
jgi:hypothetical protein